VLLHIRNSADKNNNFVDGSIIGFRQANPGFITVNSEFFLLSISGITPLKSKCRRLYKSLLQVNFMPSSITLSVDSIFLDSSTISVPN